MKSIILGAMILAAGAASAAIVFAIKKAYDKKFEKSLNEKFPIDPDEVDPDHEEFIDDEDEEDERFDDTDDKDENVDVTMQCADGVCALDEEEEEEHVETAEDQPAYVKFNNQSMDTTGEESVEISSESDEEK